ncbi:MAG: dihydrolipoyl dehydrogenase [Eubacteriaceae bacterium]|jgi:dihydrolipoamide dehydrogenase|nr:dihydrolipoyl dehydrogenase [Eubacteriaceae bacterium]
MAERYDLAVIGGGIAGYTAAEKAASLGKKAAVIENRDIGGTCLNRGCIPTKTLLHSAELMRNMKAAEEIGVDIAMARVNMNALQDRKQEVTAQLRSGIEQMLKKKKIDIIRGTGKITAPHHIEVSDRGDITAVEAENILIATGSKPVQVPIPGADLDGVMNSDTILERREQPFRTLIIIGGGVIGMEFATVYNDFGTKVVVLEAMDRILPQMDKEFSQNLKMIMTKRGTDIHAGAVVKSIKHLDNILPAGGDVMPGYEVAFEAGGTENTVRGDGVLISIGRRTNTEGLFDSSLGLASDRGIILVDDSCRTNIEGVYAAGDVIGGIQLAHVAAAEGCRAVECMFGTDTGQDISLIPSCVYTSPEIASVGMTKEDAKAKGIEVNAGKYIMSANGKSVLSQEDRGFIKIIADAETGVVLGGQIMSGRATDMIGEIALAVAKKLTVADLASVVAAHPTFSEGIREAAASMI